METIKKAGERGRAKNGGSLGRKKVGDVFFAHHRSSALLIVSTDREPGIGYNNL